MKLLIYLCALSVWLLTTTPPSAGGVEPFEPIDAQTIIDTCWEETYDLRAGTTADAREGILLSVLCLEERILEQFEVLFSPGDLTKEEAAAQLETIRMSYGTLYWKLYNEHQGCVFCGTQYYSIHLSALSRILETLLRDAVDQRNQYRL